MCLCKFYHAYGSVEKSAGKNLRGRVCGQESPTENNMPSLRLFLLFFVCVCVGGGVEVVVGGMPKNNLYSNIFGLTTVCKDKETTHTVTYKNVNMVLAAHSSWLLTDKQAPCRNQTPP